MLRAKTALEKAGIPQAVVARELGVSPATISLILNHNSWPKIKPEECKVKLIKFFETHKVAVNSPFEVVAPGCGNTRTPDHKSNQSEEDEIMLLRKQPLSPEAKRHFGVMRNPFGDIEHKDDIWVSPDIRYVRETMFQVARFGGFLAVVGESGAGKTTVLNDLEQRIHAEKHPILLIRPYVISAEDSDKKGKTLHSTHITDSILRAVAPTDKAKASYEAKANQMHQALKASHEAGFFHCLVIDEAHSLPIPTLKHLKRILELQVGFTKLVSVILVGQSELQEKLSERNREVREVVQRCEVASLLPMGPEKLNEYLGFRLGRMGMKVTDIFEESGITEIAARMISRNKSSQLYPLAIGNIAVCAMNIAARLGIPKINAEVINEVLS